MPSIPPGRTILSTIVVLSLVVGAGCLGDPTTGCGETLVTPVGPPERPDDLDRLTVRTFAADIERTIKSLDASESNAITADLDPTPDNVTRLDDGWSVIIETSSFPQVCRDGEIWNGDGGYTARYFINESVVYRAEDHMGPDSVDMPSPRKYGERIRLGNMTGNE